MVRSRVTLGRSLVVQTLSGLVFAFLLAGCHDNLSAATSADANTCYSLPAGPASKAAAPVRKVVLGLDDDNLETCAMHLEGYRLQHGLPTASGLYEDHVVFASPAGITASTGAGNIRYSVYTRAQQIDLDGKLHTLIAQEKAAGSPSGGAPPAGTTTSAN